MEEKKNYLKVIKKKLNLISIQKDFLDEKDMEALCGGWTCGDKCTRDYDDEVTDLKYSQTHG